MEQRLETTVALLRRTPGALDALLRGLPPEWTTQNEGEGTWSAIEIVGHLAYSEASDWMPRVRWVLQVGEAQPFPPVNRTGFREMMAGREAGAVLEAFARLRTKSLEELAGLRLSAADMTRTGRHAKFGKVTLSQLLATWAAHDANHLHQMARVLAHQYREAVGPWSAFLGVMHCDGHSAAA
ncbi:DinB family protein [Acidobacteria bacterium AB60]|nr:DinB family protein [Acidobacteria bacterium AB60]